VIAALRRLKTLSLSADHAAELEASVRAASSERARVALVNEELSDVARLVAVGAEVPRAAGRIALFSGVGLAIFELARQLSSGIALAWTMSAALGGIISYLACVEIGRRAKLRGNDLRDHWNALARRLLTANAGTVGSS
jgi:hypothetical protein